MKLFLECLEVLTQLRNKPLVFRVCFTKIEKDKDRLERVVWNYCGYGCEVRINSETKNNYGTSYLSHYVAVCKSIVSSEVDKAKMLEEKSSMIKINQKTHRNLLA